MARWLPEMRVGTRPHAQIRKHLRRLRHGRSSEVRPSRPDYWKTQGWVTAPRRRAGARGTREGKAGGDPGLAAGWAAAGGGLGRPRFAARGPPSRREGWACYRKRELSCGGVAGRVLQGGSPSDGSGPAAGGKVEGRQKKRAATPPVRREAFYGQGGRRAQGGGGGEQSTVERESL